MIIEISLEMKKLARELSWKHIRADSEGTQYFETENEFQNKFVGYIGQLAFGKVFSDWEMSPVNETCKGDSGDFINNGRLVDVKTAQGDCPCILYVKKAQLRKMPMNFYVLAHYPFNTRFVNLMGFATLEMVQGAHDTVWCGVPCKYLYDWELLSLNELR